MNKKNLQWINNTFLIAVDTVTGDPVMRNQANEWDPIPQSLYQELVDFELDRSEINPPINAGEVWVLRARSEKSIRVYDFRTIWGLKSKMVFFAPCGKGWEDEMMSLTEARFREQYRPLK